MRYQIIKWVNRDCFIYIVLKDIQENKVLRYEFGDTCFYSEPFTDQRVDDILTTYFNYTNSWQKVWGWTKEYESNDLEECEFQYMLLNL